MTDFFAAAIAIFMGVALICLGIGLFVFDAVHGNVWWAHIAVAFGGVGALLFGGIFIGMALEDY